MDARVKTTPSLPGRAFARVARAAIPALLVAAAAACAGDAAPGDAAAGLEPRDGGTLVIAGPNELSGLNVLVAVEAYSQDILANALSLPLVALDSAGGYVPRLAESWELEGDSAVVFRLRRDVRWHDGAATTAHDVTFTFDRLKDRSATGAAAAALASWHAATAIDSFTVRTTFAPHDEPLLDWVRIAMAPRHLLDSIPMERMQQAVYNEAPVGNGPFRVVSHAANDRWVFEANPDFAPSLGGRPHLDRVVWRVVPENAAQVAELRTGSADLILSPRAEELAGLDAMPGVRALVKPSRQFQFIGWNGRREPLGDARVRRALALAIDRRVILDAVRSGYGSIAAGPIPPFHWAYPDTVAPLPYDPAAARRLFAEAGLADRDGDGTLDTRDGQAWSIELKIPAGNGFARDIAEMLVAQLAEVGVRATVRQTDFSTLVEDITSPARNFDAVLMGLENEFRIDLRGPFHSSQLDGPFQLGGYRNASVDSLIDRAESARDRDAARPFYHRLQRVLRDEQPWTFLWYAPQLFAVSQRVHGVVMDERGAFVNVAEWWVDEG